MARLLQLAAALILLLLPPWATADNATETAALLEFKAGLFKRQPLVDWTRATPTCQWAGVSCGGDGQVVEL